MVGGNFGVKYKRLNLATRRLSLRKISVCGYERSTRSFVSFPKNAPKSFLAGNIFYIVVFGGWTLAREIYCIIIFVSFLMGKFIYYTSIVTTL